ncbi:hypothetical protein BASA61_007346 [Batrachochytrium salamandrivorans]|nr:hypothetical protein BASA60_011486 [Batrachochytrium salamandrivorans]KAH6584601.1 hypothetical protein BASA61_007346 [Batrachochytrium salamandrivorans]KAH9248805.1 hypothetical protein BASA81_013505 [Batrachochytrium salamandrivorans]KAH9264057.1 hypothetical protein BASA83_012492 [Batrachochytrium salamandrivorans]KAJ1342876.1 hypothetical protein BSLG_002535 [Batrachochytrium salamandrivorans]
MSSTTTASPSTSSSFVNDLLHSTISRIDTAFSIPSPNSHSLSVLFGSATNNRTGINGRTPTRDNTAITNSRSNPKHADIQTIWDAINSPFFGQAICSTRSYRSPSLLAATRRIKDTLATPLDSILTDPDPALDIAHLVLLSKSLAIIRALALQELLDDVYPLSCEISYWESRQTSKRSILLYILETLPHRIAQNLYAALCSFFGTPDPGTDELDVNLPISDAYPISRSPSPPTVSFLDRFIYIPQTVGLGLALHLRPLSWIDSAKHEIASKREHLAHAQLWQAQCLGILIRSNVDGLFQPAQTLHPIEPPENAPSSNSVPTKNKARKMGRLLKQLAFKRPLSVVAPSAPVTSSTTVSAAAELREILYSNVTAELATIRGVVAGLTKIGQDISTVDEFQPLAIDILVKSNVVSVTDLYKEVLELTDHLENMAYQFNAVVLKLGRPSFFLRAWVPTLFAFVAGAVVVHVTTPTEIIGWANGACQQVCEYGRDFFANWIMHPLENILKIIRHDGAELARFGTESLSSDLDSLERMVVEFARDHGNVDTVALQDIGSRVRLGDLTVVLQKYEEEIKTPFKNVIRGDLIRSLLIQIQKAKVDGELAISALDKLLKSNELNFAFLAIMPTLVIMYTAVNWIRQALTPLPAASSETVKAMKRSLRNIERIFNQMDLGLQVPSQQSISFGLLLCETCRLHECATMLPASLVDSARLTQDIGDLESIVVFQAENVSTSGIAVLGRIWRTNAIFGK